MTVPASIRNNNPGAMWPGPSATKFGSVEAKKLKDAQGNKIATFQDSVSGAAALFDLLLRAYAGKTVRDAIAMWSGGNHVDSYVAHLSKRAGVKASTVLTREYIANPVTGVAFAKAMAEHEAGQPYPLDDSDWQRALAMALEQVPQVPEHLAILQDWCAKKVREYPGSPSNPLIDKMFLIAGHPEGKFRDDTAWCSICQSAAVAMTGGYPPVAPGNTMARSWLKWGVPVKEKDIRPGDIRVITRGPAPFGHVDCVESVDFARGIVTVIGGNVSDGVARYTAPLKGALGYRRRVDGPKPVTVAVKESQSLMSLARGALAAGVATVISYWEWLTGLLPNIAGDAGASITAVRSISEQAGVPLPAKFLAGFAAAAVIAAVIRLVRNQQDKP